jgi:hypothetical protein
MGIVSARLSCWTSFGANWAAYYQNRRFQIYPWGKNGVYGHNVEMIVFGVFYKEYVIFYFVSASNITQPNTVLLGRVD